MNVYCMGNRGSGQEYGDNYTRTFTGHPKMNDGVCKMIQRWVNAGSAQSIYLFFAEKCEYDHEYSGFLMREAMRGNL